MSMSEFLHMGGYAFYVWGAYGFSAVALAINLLQPLIRTKHQEDTVARTIAAGSES